MLNWNTKKIGKKILQYFVHGFIPSDIFLSSKCQS